ncbi:leucyl aminopeptidase family protein [Rhizobium halophytocola]|uniref:Leucyl aminopeptidase n=1 Tax=Rhizobium halophytocola TaxID=735519 RepID=A0ABS4E1F8_9HYPH|nr:leucyl aminopeptidase family protein [Rhizobium halophytocola]MBP1851758.1 leucyl aminopeptidase [Rhizobium halophytocola]
MTPFQYIERPLPFTEKAGASRPVHLLTPADLEANTLADAAAAWAEHAGFQAQAGDFLLVPGSDGAVNCALFGLGSDPAATPFTAGRLARLLPPGAWHIETPAGAPCDALLGYGLGSYSFRRYLAERPAPVRIGLGDGVDAADLGRQVAGAFLARDLINTPTNDMGPADLEDAARRLAAHYGAEVSVVAGDDLLAQNFPLIHTVGRAAATAPRLIEMRWGRKGGKRVTLVGKGVCFDTGGLDIKGAANMLLMKKDMGGAANVLGLALMIMDAGLPIDLRVLIPAVENSIAGNAFRPGDVYKSRKGLTVQIDNTDAEGRLVLADALAYADEEEADLIIDMATLTGAARVALGAEVPPFFTDDEALAGAVAAASEAVTDPVWRLPLHKGYEKLLKTPIADLTNAPSGGMAGSITAALFLKRFVTRCPSWAHFDIYGWSQSERAQGPAGGEAQAIRALYHHLRHNLA